MSHYDDAMKITDQAEADVFFDALVTEMMDRNPSNKSRTENERIQRDNLAYFAGYYDEETRRRVEKLFNCAHPVFGSVEEYGIPTPEQAFESGKLMGAMSKFKK